MPSIETRPNFVSEERMSKMRAYYFSVAKPLAESFMTENNYQDPRASLLVAGSSMAQNGDSLRVGSDFDLIVISSALRKPERYANFLNALAHHNRWFLENTGIVPEVFTEVGREEDVRYIGMTNMRRSINQPKGRSLGDQFLPVHFLYYHSFENMARREPTSLLRRLLASSVPLVGEIPSQFDPSEDPYPNNLNSARWIIERSLAELILNQLVMPEQYLLLKYKNGIVGAVRGPMLDAIDPNADSANIIQILKYLDRQYGSVTSGNLLRVFSPLLEIHHNDCNDHYPTMELIKPALKLMKLIDYLAQRAKAINYD